jgi:hypothetical protein
MRGIAGRIDLDQANLGDAIGHRIGARGLQVNEDQFVEFHA